MVKFIAGIIAGIALTMVIAVNVKMMQPMEKPVKPNRTEYMSKTHIQMWIDYGDKKIIAHNLNGKPGIELITGINTNEKKVLYYLNDEWKECAIAAGYIVDQHSKLIPEDKLRDWSYKMQNELETMYTWALMDWRGKAYKWNKLHPEDIIEDEDLPPKEKVLGGFLY